MTKMYCDRCGAEINIRRYALLSHRTMFARQRLIPAILRTDWIDVDKDLCPECENSYIHWFMNPEPPKEG